MKYNTMVEMIANGFDKIMQTGGCYVVASFYNPITKELISGCVRDYDYSDCSRDNDDLYHAPINDLYYKQYLHDNGIIQVGDKVVIFKGRKYPIGTVSEVVSLYDYKDRYGRPLTTYARLKNGYSVDIRNLRFEV